MNNADSKIVIFTEMDMSFLFRYPDGTREQLVVPATAQIKVGLVTCMCVCVCVCGGGGFHPVRMAGVQAECRSVLVPITHSVSTCSVI